MLNRLNVCLHIAALLIGCFCFSMQSPARDSGQYADISPDVKAWIEGLTDDRNVNCCAESDGIKPQEVEWDLGARHYRVKIEDLWFTVPDGAVVKLPNRLGHAVVWYAYDVEGIVIRCFLPGSGA